MTPRRLIDALGRALASKHVLWWVPALVAVHLAFGLDAGWIIDDHVHRAALTRHPELPEWHRSPEALFMFTDGDPEENARGVARGTWPWWSAPDLLLAPWRPLTGWIHALDYRVWPESPRLMHLHSLAWLLLAVIVLLALYRRVLPRPAVAGLAGLLYAVDDSQSLPVLWIANRNAVIAVALGAASLAAHDRWRGFRALAPAPGRAAALGRGRARLGGGLQGGWLRRSGLGDLRQPGGRASALRGGRRRAGAVLALGLVGLSTGGLRRRPVRRGRSSSCRRASTRRKSPGATRRPSCCARWAASCASRGCPIRPAWRACRSIRASSSSCSTTSFATSTVTASRSATASPSRV